MDIKSKLLEEFPFKTELHLHTSPVSRCATVTPEDVVNKYAALGFRGLVITNHIDPGSLSYSEDEWVSRYLADYDATVKAAEKFGIYVYLGAEIRFTENANDYLVYGADEELIALAWRHIDKGIEKFYKAAKSDKNLILQAHPFRDNMERNYTSELDGIEVFNMALHNARIPLAARFAAENPGVITGGNDLHYQDNYPIFATRFRSAPENCYELASRLKSGEYIFSLGNSIII